MRLVRTVRRANGPAERWGGIAGASSLARGLCRGVGPGLPEAGGQQEGCLGEALPARGSGRAKMASLWSREAGEAEDHGPGAGMVGLP